MAKNKRGNSEQNSESKGQSDSGDRALEDSRRENKGLKAIKLDKWQQEIVDAKGHILLCTGRQVGKTTVFAIKAAERMVSQKNCRIIVGSLTEDQAQLIIIMTLTHLEKNYRSWIKKPYSRNITKGSITLNNGSKIIARPVGTTGDAFRGFTGDVLIADEASRMPSTMWAAAKPTLLTTGGEIWMCSTPFGQEGYFYECYLNKHNRFKVFHVSSEEVIQNRPLSDVWTQERREGALRLLDEEKSDMSELEYAQEYLAKFIEDLRQFFSDKVIEKSCILNRRNLINRHAQHYLGCDIARMGEDEGTMEVIDWIDKDNMQHTESIITKKQLTTQTHDNIINLNKLWNFKQIGIDAGAGSLGVGILDWLLRDPSVKRKVIDLNNLKIIKDHRGEKTGRLLKEGMYQNMLMLMESGRLKLLNDNDVRLSLKSVQYEYTRKQGQQSKIRIFGKYTHIAEGLVRAAWLANQKSLNVSISYI